MHTMNVYANYRPSAVGHDFPVNILRDYSTIGQEEGRTAFHLLGAGFAGSGWESQSIYSLYNTTAVSTTYILAYAQNTSMPIYTLNQSNINDTIGNLTQPDWVKDWVKGAVKAGYVVIIPEGWVDIDDWYGTGWAQIEPSTGLGAYIIAGGLSQEVREQVITYGGRGTIVMNMTALREGLWNTTYTLYYNLRYAPTPEKDKAKQEVKMALFVPLAIPASYLLLYAVLSEGGIVTISPVPPIGVALAAIMLSSKLGIYFYYTVLPPAKIWVNSGELFAVGG